MLCQPPLGFLLAGLVQRLCQGLEKSSISPVKCDSLQHERVTQAEK